MTLAGYAKQYACTCYLMLTSFFFYFFIPGLFGKAFTRSKCLASIVTTSGWKIDRNVSTVLCPCQRSKLNKWYIHEWMVIHTSALYTHSVIFGEKKGNAPQFQSSSKCFTAAFVSSSWQWYDFAVSGLDERRLPDICGRLLNVTAVKRSRTAARTFFCLCVDFSVVCCCCRFSPFCLSSQFVISHSTSQVLTLCVTSLHTLALVFAFALFAELPLVWHRLTDASCFVD